jgi:hypothetical protein
MVLVDLTLALVVRFLVMGQEEVAEGLDLTALAVQIRVAVEVREGFLPSRRPVEPEPWVLARLERARQQVNMGAAGLEGVAGRMRGEPADSMALVEAVEAE